MSRGRVVAWIVVMVAWAATTRSVDAQAPRVVLDAIVATVNGQVITASDVRAAALLVRGPGGGATEPVAAAAMIDRLIDRALMLEEVERAGLPDPAAALVEARRRDLDATLGGAAAQLAARDAMTERRLLAWLRDDLRIDTYLAQRFTAAAQPTEEEVAAYFAANAARFTDPGVPADDAATGRARVALIEIRRQALIDAWVEGLRRRADIVAQPR